MKVYSVYKIENTNTKRVYIGKCYTDPFTRLRAHLRDLRKGYHFNSKLQEDFNNSHISEWIFSVLEIGLNRKQASIIEKKNMYSYNVFETGYNTRMSNNSQLHKHQKIVEMIQAGKKYEDIRDELNVSLGTICNCKKMYIERRGL